MSFTRFYNFINKKHVRILVFLILPIILTYLFSNSPILGKEFTLTPWPDIFPYILMSAILHFCFWFSALYLSLKSKLVAYILLPVLILIQYACYYAGSRYGAVPDEAAIAVLNTTFKEAIEAKYINTNACILFVAIFVITYLTIIFARLINPLKAYAYRTIRKIDIIVLLGGTLSVIIPSTLLVIFPDIAAKGMGYYVTKSPWRLTFPKKNTFAEAEIYTLQNFDLYETSYIPGYHFYAVASSIYKFYFPKKLLDSTIAASQIKFKNMPDAVVLYIGESFRADHSPFNGYHRNTLPNISKLANIINIPHIHSLSTQTIPSIYKILTLEEEASKKTYSSFTKILAKHHYKQHLLVGSNTEGMWWNTSLIASQLLPHMKLHSRPSSAAEYNQQITKLKKDKPLFALIEDGAGHIPYVSSSTPFGTKTDIDRFDNSLIDIDARVHSIIEALKEQSTILFFTSDHGESFGENGRIGHGGPMTAKEQTHCCAFIWYSDLYAQQHPEIISNLKKNAHLFTSHSFIYHTILSLAGIKSDLQNPAKDMTQPQPEKHAGAAN